MGNNGEKYKVRETIIISGREGLKYLRVPGGASYTKKYHENGNEIISFYEKSFDGYGDAIDGIQEIPKRTIKIEIDSFFN